MTIILEGKSIANALKEKIRAKRQQVFKNQKIYLAIIFIGGNNPSQTYVRSKQKFGQEVGIAVEIIGQKENTQTQFQQLVPRKNKQYTTAKGIIQLIQFLNHDPACVGIIVQLPLPENIWQQQAEIMQHITPIKDIDSLGGAVYGISNYEAIEFLGATPQAVWSILEHYHIDQIQGKTITIIGQSSLIGEPLATHCMKHGATVISCNKDTPNHKIRQRCQESDYIFSCTGHIHLVDEHYIRKDQSQIVIDIGYGYKDGQAAGDIQHDQIKEHVYAYTPVPGGVGPLTVACLFDNIFKLQTIFNR